MRFVKTKRGSYEIMNDCYGKGIAVSTSDYDDVFQFDKPIELLSESEIVARINDSLE